MQGWKMRQKAAAERRTASAAEREEIRRIRAEHYAKGSDAVIADPAPLVVEQTTEIPDDTIVDQGTGEFIDGDEDAPNQIEQLPEAPADAGAGETAEPAPTGEATEAAAGEQAPTEGAAEQQDAGEQAPTAFELTDEQLREKLIAVGVQVDGRWKRTRLISEARVRSLIG